MSRFQLARVLGTFLLSAFVLVACCPLIPTPEPEVIEEVVVVETIESLEKEVTVILTEPPPTETPEPTEPPPTDVIVETVEVEPEPSVTGDGIVRLAWPGSDLSELERLESIVEQLNEEAVYQIEVIIIPREEYWDWLLVSFLAGDAPDLMWVDQAVPTSLYAQGWLLPIDTCQGEVEDDQGVMDVEDYLGIAVDGYARGGALYGLSWTAEPLMLYVNQEHLRKVGIGPEKVNDWTWDEFRIVSDMLTDEGVAEYGFIPYGGFVVPTELPIEDWRERIWSGSASMVMDGASVNHEGENPDIAAYLLPKASNGGYQGTSAYVEGMSIYAGTDDYYAACQVFVDLTEALQDSDAFAPRVSVLEEGWDEKIERLVENGYLDESKVGTSTDNIRLAMLDSLGDMVWVPYYRAPSSLEIGNAQLVPGSVEILEAIGELQADLGENGVKINTARAVVIQDEAEPMALAAAGWAPLAQDGPGEIHLAPVAPESVPDTETAEEFYEVVETPEPESEDVVIGVIQILDICKDLPADVTPEPEDLKACSYSVTAINRNDNQIPRLKYSRESGSVVWIVKGEDVDEEGKPLVEYEDLGEKIDIPTAAIEEGSRKCVIRLDGIKFKWRCRR